MSLLKSYCKPRANCNLLFPFVAGGLHRSLNTSFPGHPACGAWSALHAPPHLCQMSLVGWRPSPSSLRLQGSAYFQDFGWKGKDTKGSFKLTAAYTFHFFSFDMTKKEIQIFKFLLLLILLLFDNLVSSGLSRSCIPSPFTFSLNVVPNLRFPPPNVERKLCQV